jgi:methionine-rich copper-binding protein CopC
MKRLLSLFIAALLALASGHVGAHAVVTGTSLKERPVKTGTPTKVLLSFNSDIEVGLSRVLLVSQGDIHVTIPIAAGRKRGQLLVEVPALAPGEYALKCRVFAADGHLTEEILLFRVSE